MLSDAELLCAAQSGDPSRNQAREELPIRFARLLRYLANHACHIHGLATSEVQDVIQQTLLGLFTAKTPFDPARCSIEAYLRGLTQTAARSHRRSLGFGRHWRHDWAHPDNRRRGLPQSVDAIPDSNNPRPAMEARDAVVPVLALADPTERRFLIEVFLRGKTIKETAAGVGADPSTVSRKLTAFYARVIAQVGLTSADCHRNPN